MTTRTSVAEALHVIGEYEQHLAATVAPVRTMHVEPDGLVLDEGQRLALTADGLAAFCDAVRAPHPYLRRLRREVRARVLQDHLDRGDPREVVAVLHRNGEFRAFDDPSLLRLRGTEVLEAVVESLPRDAGPFVERLSFQDDMLIINVLGDAVTEEIAPGDAVAAGLQIRHSLTGARATRVESFILRLVCANGMRHADHLARQRTA